MLWIKNEETKRMVSEYDHITVEEIMKLHEKFGDCPVILIMVMWLGSLRNRRIYAEKFISDLW